MVTKYKLGSFNTLIIYYRNITYVAKLEYVQLRNKFVYFSNESKLV
jgi:hypothetical protein